MKPSEYYSRCEQLRTECYDACKMIESERHRMITELNQTYFEESTQLRQKHYDALQQLTKSRPKGTDYEAILQYELDRAEFEAKYARMMSDRELAWKVKSARVNHQAAKVKHALSEQLKRDQEELEQEYQQAKAEQQRQEEEARRQREEQRKQQEEQRKQSSQDSHYSGYTYRTHTQSTYQVADVKKGYRELVLRLHPDTLVSKGKTDVQAQALRLIQDLNQAKANNTLTVTLLQRIASQAEALGL